MQKTHLLSVHNNPRKNSDEKQIQPLFKKRFASGDQETSAVVQRPPTGNLKIRSVRGSRSKNSSSATQEELEFQVSRLKSEKLQVYKELWTYEERFFNKLCLKARIEDILTSCLVLLEEEEEAEHELYKEKEILKILDDGLKELTTENFETTLCPKDYMSGSFCTLVQICGELCIASVVSENKIQVYPEMLNEPLTLTFKTLATDSEKDLTQNLFPFLHFKLENEVVKLKFSTEKQSHRTLFCKPKGCPNSFMALEISLNPLKIKANLKGTQLRISLNDHKLQAYLEKSWLVHAANYIEKQLCILQYPEEEPCFVWNPESFDIEKYLYVQKTKRRGSMLTKGVFEKSDFEDSSKLLGKSTIHFGEESCECSLYYNLLLGKYRVFLTYENLDYYFLEENYPQLFKHLYELQDLEFSQASVMFKSLELEFVVKSLLLL